MEKAMKKYFPIFVLPTLIAFTIAFVIPFIMGTFLSFTSFRTVIDAKWIGLENYRKVFADQDFLNALKFSIKFTIVSVLTINTFAFILALILTRGIPLQSIFRTIIFMPNLIGGIVLGYIWQLILNGFFIKFFGVTLTQTANYGFWGLVIMTNWQLIGYMMVIYIAGIQNIPGELVEAAEIDGAGPFKILTSITLPMVMPSITICLFLTLSNSFKLFDQNLALTNGAPGKSTAMLALDIYKTFYGSVGYEGVGQAKAVIFFILVAVIAFVQLYFTRRKEVES